METSAFDILLRKNGNTVQAFISGMVQISVSCIYAVLYKSHTNVELLSHHEYAYAYNVFGARPNEYVCVDYFHNVSGARPGEHQEPCADIMRIKGWCEVVYM
jgi:hypothetical protein